MDWKGIVNAVVEVGAALASIQAFHNLISLDRNAAMQQISSLVERMTPQQLDDFEATFLKHSMGLISQQQRERAMEIYAWLKVAETLHYQKFRGFTTQGHSLTT